MPWRADSPARSHRQRESHRKITSSGLFLLERFFVEETLKTRYNICMKMDSAIPTHVQQHDHQGPTAGTEVRLPKWEELSRTSQFAIYLSLWFGIYVVSSLFLPFSLPIYLVFVVGLVPMIFMAPQAGLLMTLILTMLFERWFTLQPILLGSGQEELLFYPIDAVISISLLAALAGWARERSTQTKEGRTVREVWKSPLTTWLWVFWCATAIILGWSVLQHGDTSLIVSAGKQLYWYAFMVGMVLLTTRTKRDLFRIEKTLILGSLFTLGFLALAIVRGDGLWTEFQPLSTEGTRLLSQTHAFFLGLGSLFLLARLPNLVGRWRWFAGAAILLQWAGVALSLTRHLYVALPVGAAVLFILLSRSERWKLVRAGSKAAVAGIVLMVAALLIAVLVPNQSAWEISKPGESIVRRIESFGNPREDASTLYRLEAWKAAGNEWLGNPILGIGFGQQLFFDVGGYPTIAEVRGLHNDIYGLLVQGGLLLFIPFMIMAFRGFWLGIVASRDAKDARLREVAMASSAGLAMFGVAAFFSTYLIINLFIIFFWLLLAMLMLTARFSQEEGERVGEQGNA